MVAYYIHSIKKPPIIPKNMPIPPPPLPEPIKNINLPC